MYSIVKARVENLHFHFTENYLQNSVSEHTTALTNFELRLCLRDVKS